MTERKGTKLNLSVGPRRYPQGDAIYIYDKEESQVEVRDNENRNLRQEKKLTFRLE